MTLEQIVLRGQGTAGKWYVRVDGDVRHLYHYEHKMLTWNFKDPCDESVLDYSTGWGSVSDQGGMNKAFRTLGISLYFSRRDGALIS